MDLKLSEPGQICLQELSNEKLARVMVELIRSDGLCDQSLWMLLAPAQIL